MSRLPPSALGSSSSRLFSSPLVEKCVPNKAKKIEIANDEAPVTQKTAGVGIQIPVKLPRNMSNVRWPLLTWFQKLFC